MGFGHEKKTYIVVLGGVTRSKAETYRKIQKEPNDWLPLLTSVKQC